MIHFLNDARHSFHAIYIGEEIFGVPEERVRAEIDSYNQDFCHASDRRFLFGILARHPQLLSLEKVEVDTMPAALIREFNTCVARYVDPALPLVFKPANQLQERIVREIPPSELPRVFAHELFSTAPFVPLNPGTATGRLRAFRTEAEYRAATLDWSDIIVMDRVPDDIPRLSGIVNARHTTPLSHTNVLATGGQIPNAVQVGALAVAVADAVDGAGHRDVHAGPDLPGEPVPADPGVEVALGELVRRGTGRHDGLRSLGRGSSAPPPPRDRPGGLGVRADDRDGVVSRCGRVRGFLATVVLLCVFAVATGISFPVRKQLLNDSIPDPRYRATLLSMESIVDRAVCALVAVALGAYLAAGQLDEFLVLSAVVTCAVMGLLAVLLLAVRKHRSDRRRPARRETVSATSP